jgi:hypothetical protein
MIAVAILGIAATPTMNAVLGYRSRVASVRRGYAALACAQAEVERLRLESPEALKSLVGKLAPRSAACEPWALPLELIQVRGPAGLLAIRAEITTAGGAARFVSLPFLPSGGGVR